MAEQPYDLNGLTTSARQWRAAAASAEDAAHRDCFARVAAKYEQIVERSMRTPVLAEVASAAGARRASRRSAAAERKSMRRTFTTRKSPLILV